MSKQLKTFFYLGTHMKTKDQLSLQRLEHIYSVVLTTTKYAMVSQELEIKLKTPQAKSAFLEELKLNWKHLQCSDLVATEQVLSVSVV